MAERGVDRGGRGRGERCGGRQQEDVRCVPVTKLGRLVKWNKIRKIEERSLLVKAHHNIEQLVPGLKDEVMKITPVQKQARGGQRTRFKALVVPCKECGSVTVVPCNEGGSVTTVRMVPVPRGSGIVAARGPKKDPAPRGSGIVATRVPKKDLQLACTEGVVTSSRGSKRPRNCVEATFDCLMKTYGFLTPSSGLRPSM